MKIRARIACYGALALSLFLTWLVLYQSNVIELQHRVIMLQHHIIQHLGRH